jgi:hypothetical protein
MTKYEPCFFGGRSLVLEMEIPGSLVMTAKWTRQCLMMIEEVDKGSEPTVVVKWVQKNILFVVWNELIIVWFMMQQNPNVLHYAQTLKQAMSRRFNFYSALKVRRKEV